MSNSPFDSQAKLILGSIKPLCPYSKHLVLLLAISPLENHQREAKGVKGLYGFWLYHFPRWEFACKLKSWRNAKLLFKINSSPIKTCTKQTPRVGPSGMMDLLVHLTQIPWFKLILLTHFYIYMVHYTSDVSYIPHLSENFLFANVSYEEISEWSKATIIEIKTNGMGHQIFRFLFKCLKMITDIKLI